MVLMTSTCDYRDRIVAECERKAIESNDFEGVEFFMRLSPFRSFIIFLNHENK